MVATARTPHEECKNIMIQYPDNYFSHFVKNETKFTIFVIATNLQRQYET